MKPPKLPLLAVLSLLVACGEKDAPAPAAAPKVPQESSVDALLAGGNTAPKPAPPAPADGAPARPPSTPGRTPTPDGAPTNPLQPGNPEYDRYLVWLQKLHSGTPVEKQAVRGEIARAGLSPKERENFDKLKAHFGVKD
jgi:hypothetical protein